MSFFGTTQSCLSGTSCVRRARTASAVCTPMFFSALRNTPTINRGAFGSAARLDCAWADSGRLTTTPATRAESA